LSNMRGSRFDGCSYQMDARAYDFDWQKAEEFGVRERQE